MRMDLNVFETVLNYCVFKFVWTLGTYHVDTDRDASIVRISNTLSLSCSLLYAHNIIVSN